MDILANFAERLEEFMEYKPIKSEALGKEINIDGSTIRRWLRKESKPNLNNLIMLSEYFNCSIDFLTGRSDDLIKFIPHSTISFPERLRVVLKEKGFTRFSLDRDTKFKDSYIYSWDHGAIPDIFSVIELADLLEYSIDYLVGRER